MKKHCLLIFLSLFFISCEKIKDFPKQVDVSVFRKFGGMVFSDPDRVTMKEVHLDKGDLLGKEVIIEGRVEEIARFTTYMVLADQTAKMLVVLTDIDNDDLIARHVSGQVVKVLGTIENGKKGLPYVQARALKLAL